jgi:fucose permease
LFVLLGLTIGDPTSLNNIIVIGAGLGGFVALIFVENRQKFPTLDLSLFKIRMFAAGNLSSFLNSIAYNCGPFLRSVYLQLVMGYSAYTTGVILIPMELMVFTISPVSGRLSDKFGSRILSSIGLALNAAALFWFSALTPQSPYGSVLVSLMLFGFGRALFTSPNSSSIMSSVPAQKRGIANGVRMTLVQTGNVLSVPLSLLLMTFVMPYSRLSQIVSSSQFVNSGELAIFSQAINYACFILGIVTLLAIIPSSLRGPRQAKEQPAITEQ